MLSSDDAIDKLMLTPGDEKDKLMLTQKLNICYHIRGPYYCVHRNKYTLYKCDILNSLILQKQDAYYM